MRLTRMNQPDNRRTKRAADGIAKMLKGAKGYDYPADPRSCVVDLLTNLHHFCHENEIDFELAVHRARDHAQVERKLDMRSATPAEDGGEG